MGLTAERYQRAHRKEKGKIPEEFLHSTGYTRCYASYALSRHGKPRRVDCKTSLHYSTNCIQSMRSRVLCRGVNAAP